MREYALALVDWLACAARGREEPAARAALVLDEPVVHALDDLDRPAADLLELAELARPAP
jgi:hypothetical protein